MKQPNRAYLPALFAMLGSIFFFWSSALFAGQITVAWNASSGSTVGGYKLYYRQIGRSYSIIDVGYQTSFTLLGLQDGRAFCIAATAYNIARTLESSFSNEVCKQLPPALQDIDRDGRADLAGVNGAGQIYYTLDRKVWANVPGQLKQLVVADLDGDGRADLAGINGAGRIYYSTNLGIWTNIPGQLSQLVAADLNGDGRADLAGINGAGRIYYTLTLGPWANIPGTLTRLVTGDFNGDGRIDLAGINNSNHIYYSINRTTWTHIPGVLNQIRAKDINGDGYADIVGLSGGSIFYTTNLSTWTQIPGWLTILDGNHP